MKKVDEKMNDNKDYEKVKEALSNVVLKSINADINYGKELLSICKKQASPCLIKDIATTYMNNMENKYNIFNKLYNFVNGYKGSNSNVTISKCKWLETQIWIIEKVKEVKDLEDNLDKVNKLSKLLKKEYN